MGFNSPRKDIEKKTTSSSFEFPIPCYLPIFAGEACIKKHSGYGYADVSAYPELIRNISNELTQGFGQQINFRID